MKVGDLVRVKQTHSPSDLENKLGVVIVVGTWSADIHIIGSNIEPRIDKERLEVLNASR